MKRFHQFNIIMSLLHEGAIALEDLDEFIFYDPHIAAALCIHCKNSVFGGLS